jgi:hypothetical protein
MNINNTPSHFGKQYAGQVLPWLPSDTEESYRNHCRQQEYTEYIKSQGWDRLDAITYRINSLGFRGAELDFAKPCVVALGCSFTLGTGLPEHTVWPWLVGSALNLPVVNLAWGGYSADTCFRMAEYFLPKLNAELCVMMAPPADRIEVIGPQISPHVNFEVFMPQSMSNWYTPNDLYLKHWMINEENSRLNNLKNKLAVEMLCHKHSIKCLTYNAFDFFAKSREEVGYARDYMHAGPRGHVAAAEKILNDRPKK